MNGSDVIAAKKGSSTSFLAMAGALIVGLGLGFAASKAMPVGESKTGGLGGCPLSSSDPAVTAAATSSLAAAHDAFGAKNFDLAQRLASEAEQKSGSAAGEMLLGQIALQRGERAVALDHMKCVFALDPSSSEAAELERKLK